MENLPEKPKRGYTMSEAALAQRRAAAELSTGPVSDDGKAASSRNAWKHGLHSVGTMVWRELGYGMQGKPCKTTCNKYPCDIVTSGTTDAGKDCLDKAVYLEAFDTLMETMNTGDVAHGHGMLAAQLAGALEILNQLREEIAEHGIVVWVPMVNKQGEQIGEKPEANPAMFHYTKLLGDLGINLPELLATPRSVKKSDDEGTVANAAAAMIGTALSRAGKGPVRRPTITINAQAERVKE